METETISALASVTTALIISVFGPLLVAKMNAMHALANSNLAAVNAELKNANEKIAALSLLIGVAKPVAPVAEPIAVKVENVEPVPVVVAEKPK